MRRTAFGWGVSIGLYLVAAFFVYALILDYVSRIK